jgi:hypothetical protein
VCQWLSWFDRAYAPEKVGRASQGDEAGGLLEERCREVFGRVVPRTTAVEAVADGFTCNLHQTTLVGLCEIGTIN